MQIIMGFSKEGRTSRILRGIKTLLFLISMLISLLLFSAPVLLAIADVLLPSAILSASLSPQSFSTHIRNYDFRHSLIDIPLISLIRSAVILCVYSFCYGPILYRGPYLAITTFCSVSSLIYVSLKASLMFNDSGFHQGGNVRAMEVALFTCSLVFAIGHILVAYRTSCIERRKLLVYKIDIEAVSACKIGFPRYQKIIIQEGKKKQKSES